MEAKNSRLLKYFNNSKIELKKVTWPTKKELVNHTVLVIGFSLGMAVFLGLMDYILTFAVEKLIIK